MSSARNTGGQKRHHQATTTSRNLPTHQPGLYPNNNLTGQGGERPNGYRRIDNGGRAPNNGGRTYFEGRQAYGVGRGSFGGRDGGSYNGYNTGGGGGGYNRGRGFQGRKGGFQGRGHQEKRGSSNGYHQQGRGNYQNYQNNGGGYQNNGGRGYYNNNNNNHNSGGQQQQYQGNQQNGDNDFYGPQHRRPSTNQNRLTSPIAINKRLVELGKEKQWDALLEVADQERASFDHVNYATVMSQLGRMQSFNKEDPRFLAFLKDLAAIIEERGLPWVHARQAANIIHAIGKMKLLENSSAKRILEWISKREVAAKFAIEGDPQNVANVAWACATLGFAAPGLFAEIECRSEWLVKNGRPQEIANMVWACATLGSAAPSLFAEVDRQSEWLVAEGTPQAVANTAWACATTGCITRQLFAEIDRQAEWLVAEGNPQEVANTAWACATLGCEAPQLFAEIDRRSEWLIAQGNSQDVAHLAWACAKTGSKARRLFAEIDRQSKRFVAEGIPQEVANMAWACATAGFKAPQLFAEIECRSEWLIADGKTQNASNTAWAFATLGFAAPSLFAEIERRSEWLVNQGGPQEIANICISVALLGMSKSSEALLANLWCKAIQLFATDDGFSDSSLCQLVQTRLFAATDGVMLPQAPDDMIERMELALKTSNEHVSRSSMEVSQQLHEIGFPHECEVSPDSKTLGGMLAIDFACMERKIAIEFDGPSHYLKAVRSGNLTSTENGATKAKRRFLKQLGWKIVINIDYRHYAQAQRVSKEKQWLREKLLASGVEFS